MIDTDCMGGVMDTLSVIDHSRRPGAHLADPFGSVHILLFGDFKQLPPATSKAPFIVIPLFQQYDFRCLRQNRRVVADERRKDELEEFHEVLTDISLGKPTNSVRKFIIESYMRGADYSAETCSFEGNTSVFTKRRYRDKHNRTICRSRIQAAFAFFGGSCFVSE